MVVICLPGRYGCFDRQPELRQLTLSIRPQLTLKRCANPRSRRYDAHVGRNSAPSSFQLIDGQVESGRSGSGNIGTPVFHLK